MLPRITPCALTQVKQSARWSKSRRPGLTLDRDENASSLPASTQPSFRGLHYRPVSNLSRIERGAAPEPSGLGAFSYHKCRVSLGRRLIPRTTQETGYRTTTGD